jgi:hypothetical protein
VNVELPAQADGTIARPGKQAMRELLNRYPELELGVNVTNPANRPLGIDADGFPKLNAAACWAPQRAWAE